MAELLIVATSKTHSDPTKELRGSWKRGDIVTIQADGWNWGGEERSGFYILRITDRTPAQIKGLLDGTFDVNLVPVRRRKWESLVDAMPPATKTALFSGQIFEVTWAQVASFLRNKITLVTADVTPP